MSGCHDPSEEPKLIRDLRKMDEEINSLRGQIEGLHDHIEKLYDMINLEDRITASDVLNRLTQLEFHKTRQVDENRKLSRIVGRLEDDIHDLQVFKSAKLKIPHKCPICEGETVIAISENKEIDMDECHGCEGKGIVWG